MGIFRPDMTSTIVEYFGKGRKSRCGYCKRTNSSASAGMWAHYLTPQDYQDLIDRGWRRSGKYCYKPTMTETCCPQYTIRCSANEFKPTKKHKKVLKRFRNFIVSDAGSGRKRELVAEEKPQDKYSDPLYSSDDDNETTDEETDVSNDFQSEDVDMAEKKVAFDGTDKPAKKETPPTTPEYCVETSDKNVVPSQNGTSAEKSKDAREASESTGGVMASPGSPVKKAKPGAGPDPTKPKAKKAKELRREKARLKGKILTAKQPKNAETTLEDLTEFFLKGDQKQNCHSFELRLVRATESDPEFQRTFDESFKVYQKYQMMIHKDKAHDCTASQLTRFLCNSPILEGLPPIPKRESTAKKGAGFEFPSGYFPAAYGSFHQQYILDGRIICVAVLDVLPDCVSSVYLYYDPDYSFLSLGTLSALYELAFVRQLSAYWSERVSQYYMGFYIHSCPKMRYKSQYSPSNLLCPETFRWIEVGLCRPLLDASKYSRLERDPSHRNQLTTTPSANALDSVNILHRHRIMSFANFRREAAWRNADEEQVSEYLTLVGEKASRSILLYRS